ncbi:MAG: hypothetical protein WBO68_10275, partial [Pyrinomonadaceae bacterium]
MKRSSILFVLAISLAALATSIFGQGSASPLTIRLQPFLSGLSSPVHITSSKDGTKRLFVIQQ